MKLRDSPIIKSLADQDLYKFTMAQAVLHHCPGTQVEFAYRCRTPGVDLRPLADEIREQVQHVATLRFTGDELEFLSLLAYISPDFVDFMRVFRLSADAVQIAERNGALDIRVRGTQVHVSWWEIYLLSIISELHARHVYPNIDENEGHRRLTEKIRTAKDWQKRQGPDGKKFRLIEFGTRRRYGRAWQEAVLMRLHTELAECLVGTSNVRLAMDYGLRAFGTFAHEWFQIWQATDVRLIESQKRAMDVWAREFRGQLGIALTDIITMDAFLRDFDFYFAKLFDGCRHDSGDPRSWAEKLIAHYRRLGIDPRTKWAVFSDSLNIPKALALCGEYEGRIMTSFGIGTDLTNDLGVPALNQVIKITECNGQPTAKISDTPGKSMCEDAAYSAYLKRVFGVQESEPLPPKPTAEVGSAKRGSL